MKDKQQFIDAMEIKQDADGHWHIYGSVKGNVHGNVDGSVWGSVKGNVGYVMGNVWFARRVLVCGAMRRAMSVIARGAKAVDKYIRDSVLEYNIRSARRSIRKLRRKGGQRMKDKQEFIDAMDLQQDADGHWFVAGTVCGDIQYVVGDVGQVSADIMSSVKGTVGYVRGDVGSVNGSVEGNVRGSVRGSFWSDVEGTINGRKWQFAEEDSDE